MHLKFFLSCQPGNTSLCRTRTRVQQQRKTSNKNQFIHSTSISKTRAMKYNINQNISTFDITDSRQILQSLFYKKSTIELAKRLLGKMLVRTMNDGTIVSGSIVETEAYLGVTDASCHCYGGRKTPKTEAMFRPPGTAYVYNVYFQYCCFNISSNGKLTCFCITQL